MEDELLISEDRSVAYLPKSGAMVSMGTSSKVGKTSDSVSLPATAATDPKINEPGTAKFATWGDDNLFPQKIIELAEKSTELPALLDWKARAAYGSIVLPYQRFYDETTNDWGEKPITDPDIVNFFLNENTKRYYWEAYTDFYWFWNVFPDMIKNDAGDKIAYIGTHDASWCRWAKQNASGVVDTVFICSDWNNQKEDNTIPLPVLNPYQWDAIDKLKLKSNIKRFVYPVSYPSPGKAYYQLAPWDGFRTSGWMALAQKIPEFKNSLMEKQIVTNYLIKIPTTYWPALYPEWNSLKPEEKRDKKKEKLKEIDDKLSNVQNAGKSILAEVGVDTDGKLMPGWDIQVIDNKLKDGAYIEDSQEASAHLLRALSLDGTLVGQGPGRDLNAGGGSDKLIAFNMYCALLSVHHHVIDEPVYFASRYNGYFERYPYFFIKHIEATPKALDTSRKVSTEVQKQWPAKD